MRTPNAVRRTYEQEGFTPAVAAMLHERHKRPPLRTSSEAPLVYIACTQDGRCWRFRARGTGWTLWRVWPELTGRTQAGEPIDNETLMAEGVGTNPHDKNNCSSLAIHLVRHLADPTHPLADENPARRPTTWTPNE